MNRSCTMGPSESPAFDSPGRLTCIRLPRTRRATILVYELLAAFAVLVLGIPLEAQDLPLDECHRVSLSSKLSWPTSGIWTGDREALLVADSLAERVVRISKHGQVESSLANKILNVARPLRSLQVLPTQIRATDGGFLLEDDSYDKIVRFDSYFEIEDSESLTVRINAPMETSLPLGLSKKKAFYRREAIYGWSPMGRGILAFGDLEGPQGWTSGFFYFDGGGRQQIFNEFAIDDEIADHNTRSMLAYVAALGDVGYILVFDEVLSIGEVRLGQDIRQLSSFPAEFRKRPKLENTFRQALKYQAARRATEIFKSYETTTMALGLYAWDNNLYLLAKHAIASNGETAWWLIRVDLEAGGKEEYRLRLPTGAAHLTVVPGDDFWALIEKGQVEGIGDTHAPYMDTSSMVLVPSLWLEDSHTTLLDPQLRIKCRRTP